MKHPPRKCILANDTHANNDVGAQIESVSIMRIYAQELKIVTALYTGRQVIIVHI